MNGYTIVSKAEFKPKALMYLRLVERQQLPLLISHRGKPVVKLVPARGEERQTDSLKALRGSVIEYARPFAPIGTNDWKILK